MWIYNVIESVKLFIIQEPLECMFLAMVLFTWTGAYIESIFKVWNWGPQCDECKEWVVWSDSITNCIKCDDHKCNDNWQDGFERGGGH